MLLFFWYILSDIDRQSICESSCETDYLGCIMHCGIETCKLECADSRSKCFYSKWSGSFHHVKNVMLRMSV